MDTTRFVTESGSVYEFDMAAKHIRRLNGTADPTPRQGKDGEWRSFESLTPIKVGQPVLITWPSSTPALAETRALGFPDAAVMKTTMTSPVKEIFV